MGTLTTATNDNLNFSIKRIYQDNINELEIPSDQEMIVSKRFTIDAGAILILKQDAYFTILGDR